MSAQGGGEKEDESQVQEPARLIQEEVRDEVRQSVQHIMGVRVDTGPAPDTFIEKLTPEHISRVLELSENDSVRDHRQRMTFGVLGIVGFIVLCLIFLAYGKEPLLKEVISAFIGFAGGFGVGKWTEKKS